MPTYSPLLQKARLADIEPEVHGLISKRTAELDGVSVTEVTFGVGARWSQDLKDYAGTASCLLPHVALMLDGTLRVVLDDGGHPRFVDVVSRHGLSTVVAWVNAGSTTASTVGRVTASRWAAPSANRERLHQPASWSLRGHRRSSGRAARWTRPRRRWSRSPGGMRSDPGHLATPAHRPGPLPLAHRGALFDR